MKTKLNPNTNPNLSELSRRQFLRKTVKGAALGALFAAVYVRRPNLHVIAIAHGLYNAIVLWLSLLVPTSLSAAVGSFIFRPW